MYLMPSRKTVWISGEVCETPGLYYSDTCGHLIRKEFVSNDIFIRCPTCYAAVRWMRFGQAYKQPATLNPRPDLGGFVPSKKVQP